MRATFSPWMRTRSCFIPNVRKNSSPFSTMRSFCSVMVSPYTKRLERQANEGFSAVGKFNCLESSRMSAFENPQSRRGLLIPSSAMARWPGL